MTVTATGKRSSAIAHQDYDDEIEELSEDFDAAEEGMLAVLLAVIAGRIAEALGLSQVAAIADDLKARSAAWVAQVIPDIYADGIAEAQQALEADETPDERMQAPEHQAMLQIAQRGLERDLSNVADRMTLDAERSLDEILRRGIEEMMTGGRGPREQARDVAAEMEEKGVSFVDRSGKRWKPKNIAETILITQAAEISNSANLTTAAELGSPGVRVFDGGPRDVDLPCKEAAGQKWSLSYALANKLQHPRCRRAFAPLPSTFSGELDRE